MAANDGAHKHHLGKPKIAYLYVALLVEEQILRLQIAVGDMMVVQMDESTDNTSGIETSRRLIEADLAGEGERANKRTAMQGSRRTEV